MLLCAKCHNKKPEADFAFRNALKGLRQSYCRVCQKIVKDAHYRANKEATRASSRRNRRKLRDKLNALKDRPCMDCGGIFPPYVMDFDHRDPSLKTANVSRLALEGRATLVFEEIAKCDLICANCHRIRTHTRGYVIVQREFHN